MQILTRNEATHRAAHLHVFAIDVVVDIRGAQDTTIPTYPVTSTLTMTSDEARTFIDIVGDVTKILLNGAPHPFEEDEDRVWVGGLPVGEPITLQVRALARYSRSGEGRRGVPLHPIRAQRCPPRVAVHRPAEREAGMDIPRHCTGGLGCLLQRD